jgi:hypothetical protein
VFMWLRKIQHQGEDGSTPRGRRSAPGSTQHAIFIQKERLDDPNAILPRVDNTGALRVSRVWNLLGSLDVPRARATWTPLDDECDALHSQFHSLHHRSRSDSLDHLRGACLIEAAPQQTSGTDFPLGMPVKPKGRPISSARKSSNRPRALESGAKAHSCARGVGNASGARDSQQAQFVAHLMDTLHPAMQVNSTGSSRRVCPVGRMNGPLLDGRRPSISCRGQSAVSGYQHRYWTYPR